MPRSAEAEPASPCTNVCALDPATGWCLGCGRTIDEIAGWGTAAAKGRRAVLAALPQRMAMLREGRAGGPTDS